MFVKLVLSLNLMNIRLNSSVHIASYFAIKLLTNCLITS